MAIQLGNSYQKTSWTVGQPITQQKMNNIEDGIAAIDTLTRNIVPAVNKNTDDISHLVSDVSDNTDSISIIQQNITTINENIELGRYGGTQVRAMVNKYPDNTPSETLEDAVNRRISAAIQEEANLRSDAVDAEADSRSREDTEIKRRLEIVETTNSGQSDAIGIAEGNITTIQNEISDARGNLTYRASRKANSLQEKIEDITWKIDDNASLISTVDGKIRATYENTQYASLAERLNGIDTVGAEVVAARGKDSSGNDNTALIQHFQQNETLIGNNTTAIENLNIDKISYSDLITNLTTNNNNKPLAASQGRELRNIIGGSFASTAGNTVKDGIDAAEQNAKDYTDELLGENAFDSTHTVASRLDAIDNVSTGAIAGLTTKITALENEIDINNVNGSRIDANESAIAVLNGNASTSGSVLNTVNTQIAAVVNSAPEAFDTLGEIAAWIQNDTSGAVAMQQAISNNADAIDALETTIGADNTTGLRKRITDLETEVDNANGNGTLNDRFTAVETTANNAAVASEVSSTISGITGRLTAIDGGTALTGTTLKDRVTTLEDKDTIVIDKPQNGSNFTEGVPNISYPLTTADYLIQADDNKYYYWRYFGPAQNQGWKLISGGGESNGGGGGTSSGLIVQQLPNAADADDNTDYFVYDAESGAYLHYRFTTINNTKQAILIGTDPNNIKKYNIRFAQETVTNLNNEQVTENRLYLYEIDYEDSNDFTQIDWDQPNAPQPFTYVVLPSGMGGGGTEEVQFKVRQRTPQNLIIPASTQQILLKLFYTSYIQDDDQYQTQNGHYTLRKGTTIIDDDDIMAADPTLINNVINQETGELYSNKTFDVTKYCTPNVTTNFALTITNGITTRTYNWAVQLVELSITTTLDDETYYPANQKLTFSTRPVGGSGTDKIVCVVMDNDEEHMITKNVRTSGDTVNIEIPANKMIEGPHLIKIYVKQIIGSNIDYSYSDPIYKDIACVSNNVVISSIYRREAGQSVNTIEQYKTLSIPYYLYIPDETEKTVTITQLYNDETITQTLSLATGLHTHVFKASDVGTCTITITCEGISINLPFEITVSKYNIEPVSEGLVFDFNPFGYSNESAGNAKFWKQEDNPAIYLSIPEGENFDWNNGGWKYDTETNAPYFCVKAGSRAQINYPLFYSGLETTGAEFKCIFKATNVKQANAIFLTSVDQAESEIINYDSDILDMTEFKSYLNVNEVYIDITDSEDNTTSTLVAVCPININNEDLTTLCNNKRVEFASQYDNTYTIESRVEVTNTFDSVTKTSETVNDDYSIVIFSTLKGTKTTEVAIEVTTSVEASETEDIIHYSTINVVRPIVNRMIVHRGLEMAAHATNIYTASGTLFNPYSEEDIIEFEYNIHKKINRKSSSYIIAYEDGVYSAPLLYYPNKNNTTFEQTQPGNIIIGSDDCDIWIYRMKFYNKELTNEQVLANFYADAIDSSQMVSRYERNVELYKDPSNTENILSTITPQSLARACPQLRVIMIEAPNLTGGKKSFIKNTKIRCIYKNGRPEDNWVALNAYHAGQGTTSDKYGDAGRNLDIMFGFNGIDSIIAEKKDNNYKFDSNYKSVLITGVTDINNSIDTFENYIDTVVAEMNENKPAEEQVTSSDVLALSDFASTSHHIYLNGTGKISLTEDSVPNAWYNIKVNIASSENANNALLQKRYDRFLPYRDIVPAMNRDGYIKNDMEFFNTVIFLRETGTAVEFTEDNSIPNPADRPWHFYGIGNIGDSKKTDDSRINIPGDPYEFCVEISDNGLVNSGFNSGVYYTGIDQNGNGTGTSYTETDYGIKYPISLVEWNNVNNTARTELFNFTKDEGWDNSFEFRYDVSTKDGNTIADSAIAKQLATERQTHNKEVFANMYKWVVTSTNEEFRNELSNWFIEDSPLYWYLFTERYTMIDSRAKNTFWHYGKIYITDDEYSGANLTALEEAIENAETDKARAEAQTAYDVALFIYQNRDTFLHGKVLNSDGTVKIDYNTLADSNHNNGYRFELWDYDNDTALGINNNGKLVFDYGLEDIDKTETGGWVFNQATSVFWRRIRENMYDELSGLYHNQLTTCWNADNLLKEFDEWQEEFPEELWRLDFERKYLRPYLTKGENKYLKDMANGRKKYQRRQFERNMAIYICSKYITGQSYDPTDFIEFRASQNQYINQACKIGIKPYGKMYINIMIGNTRNAEPLRATSDDYVWINPKEIAADFYSMQTNIFNASHIQALEGLADMYIDTAKFSTAKKLKKLVLGKEYLTDANGDYILDGSNNKIPYINRVTSQLTLESNPILEELDIRNCQGLTNQLDLVNCINLKILHAEKTSIDTFNFAESGLLQEIHLPGSTTSLEFINLKSLAIVDIASYQNLISYINYYSPLVNSQLILTSASNLSIIQISGINWDNFANMNLLANIYNKYQDASNPSNISLAGLITLSSNASYKSLELADYLKAWGPGLVIDKTLANEIKQYSVTFKYDSATIAADNIPENEQTIFTYYVTENTEGNGMLAYQDGDIWKGLDPVSLGWCDAPIRKQTESNTYIFGSSPYEQFKGWTYNGQTPTMETTFKDNIILYTNFISSDRAYKFKWYSKNNSGEDILVYTSSDTIYYGKDSNNSAPTVSYMINNNYPVVLINNNIISIFKGWSHLPLHITPSNQNIYALWQDYNLDTINFGTSINLSNLSAGELYKLCTSAALNNVHVGDNMIIPLGYDGTEAPTTTIEYNGSQIINLRAADSFYLPITTQKLFTENQEFTLMIDYKFNIENSSLSNIGYEGQTPHRQSILLSCYQDSNGTKYGFKLYYDFYDNTSRISFGDDTNNANIIILTDKTNAHNRNILVIRHPANSKNLYISHGTDINGLTDTVIEDTLSIQTFTAFNTSLVIGACLNSSNMPINDLTNRYMTYGNGTIYKLNIWNKDLGSGEAKALANWCHEKVSFGVVQTARTDSILNIPNEKLGKYMPNLYLSTLSTSEMGTYRIAYASKNEEGWLVNTPYRQMLHNRVINALPIEFQSILHAITVRTNAAIYSTQGFSTYYSVNSGNARELDDQYISIPSYIELNGSNSTYDGEALRKLPWTSAQNTIIKVYQNGSFNDTDKNAKYFNVRGQGIPINNTTLRIYKLSILDIANNSNAYEIITTENILNNGDMWDDNDTVYIYADQAAVDAGAPIIYATTSYNSKYACISNGTSSGGWIPATEWWTRSYVSNENIYQGNPNFISVAKDGSLNFNMNSASYYIDYSIGF